MDAVKLLADRLRSQSLYELVNMRAPQASRDTLDDLLKHEQFDDHDSGTASDDDVTASAAAAAAHLTTRFTPGSQTVMTSFYRVTSSSSRQPPSIQHSAMAVCVPVNCSAASTPRPVSLLTVVRRPDDLAQLWWSGLMLPRDVTVAGSSSLCSDDFNSSSVSSEDDDGDSTSTRSPTSVPASRVPRKRRSCQTCCRETGVPDAASDLDEEIQNILQDRSADLAVDTGRTASAGAAVVAGGRVTTTRPCQLVVKRQRQSTADGHQRPSLNLYKMQKLRIGRKSHSRRKVSLRNKPRQFAATPCLSKSLHQSSSSPCVVRVPAYHFRSVQHVRPATRSSGVATATA